MRFARGCSLFFLVSSPFSDDWLVGKKPSWKIWKSMGKMTSHILWKTKFMFETTNQRLLTIINHHYPILNQWNHQPGISFIKISGEISMFPWCFPQIFGTAPPWISAAISISGAGPLISGSFEVYNLLYWLYPIGSMYGIHANIWGIWMVNVTIYSIHGSYGY